MPIEAALTAVLLASLLLALLTRRRGGRFRGLVGWAAFWVVFTALLVLLRHGPPWLSMIVLGVLMFICLRTYFFVVPMRAQDRWAIMAGYVTIPLALYTSFRGSHDLFLDTVPIAVLLVLPAILALGASQEGLLDSLGRLMLGVGLFVLCASHLALMALAPRPEVLELFGVLVIVAELPQRVAGRPGEGTGAAQALSGVVVSAGLATTAGYLLGPGCGVDAVRGAWAGLIVVFAVTLGAWVGGAVVRALTLGSPLTRLVGRGAFLDRLIPAVYAALVFYHYVID